MRSAPQPRYSDGFTLFEIALVLIIIALVIGGILAGQSLIRAAQLQSVIKDVDAYTKATQAFKDKYHELPGDMPNAESFWGTDPNGCPLTAANVTPKIPTCNGNGDGFIGSNPQTLLMANDNNWYETYRAWQQLADAGFIKGSYSGAVPSNTAAGPDPGVNIPISKIPSNGFTLFYISPTAGSSFLFPANYHHVILYGAVPTTFIVTGINSNWGPGLTTAEAMVIDQKMDDGLPGTGNILSLATGGGIYTPNCATGNNPATATYNTGYTGNVACSLIFITGF